MSQQVNFLSPGCNYNPDLLSHIFFSLKPEEVGHTVTVCKDWEKIAAKVAKVLLLIKTEDYLGQKLFFFFKHTGGTVMDSFPSLSKLKAEQGRLSTGTLNAKLKELTEIKTFEVSFAAVDYVKSDYNFEEMQNFADINPIGIPNLSEKETLKKMEPTLSNYGGRREQAIYEKAFIRFFYQERWLDLLCYTSYTHIPNTGSSFFPIELFSLKARGKNYELEGTLEGKHYVPVNERVVEFIILPHQRLPRNAQPVNSVCRLDPRQFYIPALDARASDSMLNALE